MNRATLWRGSLLLGGIVLLVGLWLPWYRLSTANFLVLFGARDVLGRIAASASAWDAFTYMDVTLAVIGAYILMLATMGGRLWRFSLPVTTGLALPLLLAVALIAYRIDSPPPFALHNPSNLPPVMYSVRFGAYLTLAGAVLAVIALFTRVRHRAAP